MSIFKYAAFTMSGEGKEKNEDRLMVCGNYISSGELVGEASDRLFVIVCDGVGGETRGEDAAETVCLSFLTYTQKNNSIFDIGRAIYHANDKVRILQKRSEPKSKMATTLAGIYIDTEIAVAFSLGDTRIYKLCEKELTQLTKDHTLAQQIKDRSMGNNTTPISSVAACTLTRYIGGSRAVSCPSFKRIKVNEKTLLLICSDGVYKTLPDLTILNILAGDRSVESKCRVLRDALAKSNASDDVSAVLIAASKDM